MICELQENQHVHFKKFCNLFKKKKYEVGIEMAKEPPPQTLSLLR